MIYQIFREEGDIKYDLPSVIKVKNCVNNAELFGDVGTYRFILNHAKENKFGIVGIYQARRCLSINLKPLDYETVIHLGTNKIYHTTFFSLENANNILWRKAHPSLKDVLVNTMLALRKMIPEYTNATEQFLYSNILFPHNMFVMPITEFEKYSEWLFKILDNVKIDPNCGIPKPYSLLAERLFTVWCIHNYLPKDQVITNAIAYDKVTGEVKDNYNGIAE
jgi:hypothetical protein